MMMMMMIFRKRIGPRIYFLRKKSIALFHTRLPVFINGVLFVRHASDAVLPHMKLGLEK
jgi:hypothetical protein